MNSWKVVLCCTVLGCTAVAAPRPQLKVATEIDFGHFTNEFVRVLSAAGSDSK